MNKIEILGVKVNKTPYKEVREKVEAFFEQKKKFYIVTPNPEIILKAVKNPELKEFINNADISIPDGVGLKLSDFSLRIIKGRSFMVDLLDLANFIKLKVYLLGASKYVNSQNCKSIVESWPDIEVMGASGPRLDELGLPVGKKDEEEEKSVLNSINKFKPDMLFIAFGAPKQELWLRRNFSGLKIGGAMVVGGALDYFSGKSRVPKKIESLGLEWFWRLIHDPARIGRIFNAVIIFPLRVFINKFFSVT